MFQTEQTRLDKDDLEIVQKTATEIIKHGEKRETKSRRSTQSKKAKLDVNNGDVSNNEGHDSGHEAGDNTNNSENNGSVSIV